MNDYQKVVMKGIEPPAPKDRIKETSIKRFNKYHDNAVDEMLSFDTKSPKVNTIVTSAHVRAAMENARQYRVGERPLDDRFHNVAEERSKAVKEAEAVIKHETHKAYINNRIQRNREEAAELAIPLLGAHGGPIYPTLDLVKKYQADMVSRRVAANKAAVHAGELANLNYENYTNEEIAR